MSADQDYSQLPVDEKIAHSVWKVRLDGYNALIAQFEGSRHEHDPCFAAVATKPDTLTRAVQDPNVVAQEQALLLVCKYLEYGCPPGGAARLKTAGLVPALCEKGLASSRAGTKAKAADALVLLTDAAGSADWIVEQMAPSLEHRLPKLVAGCVHALARLVHTFGCVVVPPRLLLAALPRLFAHADRGVRAETTALGVQLYVWLRAALTLLLFPALKPVQQRDLAAEFAKVEDSAPEQKRLTRAQRDEAAARQQSASAADAAGSADVAMADAPGAAPGPAPDPFDMVEPVDVLSQMPADLYARAAAAKWKDRVEALEEAQAVLARAPRLRNDDYTELVRLFAKGLRDANVQVMVLAASGTASLARGLKAAFLRYRPLVLPPLIERTREKKPAAADALAAALDAVFAACSLLDVLDETLAGMQHKTPQVKIAATGFLRRCLAATPAAPSAAQIDLIMSVGVKLLTDSQEPVRQAATEMVGTLMKITGERELRALLDKVDENRLAKVHAVFEAATVNASGGAPPKPAGAPAAAPLPRLASAPVLRTGPSPAIPSKRLATSPAKRADLTTKAPMKSFTGRLLAPPASRGAAGAAKPPAEQPVPPHVLDEIRTLKEENRRLKEETELGLKAQAAAMEESRRARQENAALTDKIDLLYRDNTNGNLMVKQKDTQIMRLTSDLENAKLKIKSLEQVIEMMKLQHPAPPAQPSPSFQTDSFASPFASPAANPLSRHALSELSSRVNRLSIEGGAALNNSHEQSPASLADAPGTGLFTRATNVDSAHHPPGPETRSTGDGEENWRKATEVTAQLKARIEKMKQRNRLASRS
ncbi:hypothetical protein METBIDRAFT_48140 [Metschnikowia bicuspidata var. bicuspidata NRRL YB-4993]|uniref:TOG domain-containing protein n=1 Tax=Metschnikowia bicuspidata var. bicuspidata NRRL YB-4993 TaxID=869754 RepID=A0A1A0GYY8_9ASCO|nr:hypothetical protein METBIDRAFT_48140 [Metschnikowia bicuspidata var. bicuspidata NRRL YB-4993]OBA16943.1 hypothetical protein METBIDRAFT_48140 [Metschnikowia bicuspidata var. bicuspidata NRRL YB-4993]